MCVSVRPSVCPSHNAFIAKTVAISKVKASCAKHRLGRGAPLAPRMPSISYLNSMISLPKHQIKKMLFFHKDADENSDYCSWFHPQNESSVKPLLTADVFDYVSPRKL